MILLSVKPVQVGEVLNEIRSSITPNTLIVSTAASVPTRFIEQHLPDGVRSWSHAEYSLRHRLWNDGIVERKSRECIGS